MAANQDANQRSVAAGDAGCHAQEHAYAEVLQTVSCCQNDASGLVIGNQGL